MLRDENPFLMPSLDEREALGVEQEEMCVQLIAELGAFAKRLGEIERVYARNPEKYHAGVQSLGKGFDLQRNDLLAHAPQATGGYIEAVALHLQRTVAAGLEGLRNTRTEKDLRAKGEIPSEFVEGLGETKLMPGAGC